MGTENQVQAAAEVFENMTDEEARAWIAAGDYTTVAGIPLSERARRRIEQLVSGEDVQGFGLDISPLRPDVVPVPEAEVAAKGSPNLFIHCCSGQHLKEVILGMR